MRIERIVCLIGFLAPAISALAYGAEPIAEPRFTARVEKKTPGRAATIEAEITGGQQLYLVVTGAGWGWADWAEPRLTGPQGELKLTELAWTMASSGYGEPRVNANIRGNPLKIDGKPVSYGLGVHDPSAIVYDLPDGYTHFRARGGLDDGGSGGPVTFSVYADNPVFDQRVPELWLRDHNQLPDGEPESFVETIGGDRLPGVAIPPLELPPAVAAAVDEPLLFVQPAGNVNRTGDGAGDAIRVVLRFVRRVIWQNLGGPDTRYRPGTAWYRDGRQVDFRAARFDGGVVRLLTAEGVLTAAFGDLARIDLPARDPWDGYFDALALLSPHCEADLVQVETSGGLIATASQTRLRCLPPRNHDAQPQLWRVGLQPAWALDMLWVPHTAIGVRRRFAPQRVPLTRLEPTQVTCDGAIGAGSWPPRMNLNVQGGPLVTAGQAYAWGFGTQADTDLHFRLPACARTFRARVGLDQLAGTGGCARATILAGVDAPGVLWNSPLLIGSSQSFDTNDIRLPQQNEADIQLVLRTDAAHADRPPEADPFDIRDLVDWVDPELQLDDGATRSRVARQTRRWLPAWEGWDVRLDGGEVLSVDSIWCEWEGYPAHFRSVVRTGKSALQLSRTMHIEQGRNELVLRVCQQIRDDAPRAELEVVVDQQSLVRTEIPLRSRDPRKSPEIRVPLEAVADRDISVTLIQHPAEQPAAVEWSGMAWERQDQEEQPVH
jgi:hypothetical protein